MFRFFCAFGRNISRSNKYLAKYVGVHGWRACRSSFKCLLLLYNINPLESTTLTEIGACQ
jgi:hypothetical protein